MSTRFIAGKVTPHPPGTAVELQREFEGGWSTLARAVTGPDGGFLLASPEPGAYRVRVAPTAGFAEGLSQPVAQP